MCQYVRDHSWIGKAYKMRGVVSEEALDFWLRGVELWESEERNDTINTIISNCWKNAFVIDEHLRRGVEQPGSSQVS